MTSVSSVGLDMVCLPGSTPASALSGIIADECMIGVINNKTTGVRLIPVIGKSVGDKVEIRRFARRIGYNAFEYVLM